MSPALLLAACAAEPTWDPTLPGDWYAADLHVHTSIGSNDTRGDTTPETWAALARQLGLSLVSITDHSNATGSMDCEDVEDCPNQGPEFPTQQLTAEASGDGLSMVTGVELSPYAGEGAITTPTGHVGCHPFPGDPFAGLDEAFTDRPVGTVPGSDAVDWCQDHGGFTVINHPTSLATWTAYDWTSDAYDALEVYNGGYGFYEGDRAAVDAWLCDVAQGRTTVPVGGSDTHNAQAEQTTEPGLDPMLAQPTTWIRAAGDDLASLGEALVAGRTAVASQGTRLQLWVRGDEVVGPGESVTTHDSVDVLLAGEVEQPGLFLELLAVTPGACDDDSRYTDGAWPEPEVDVLTSDPLDVGAFEAELSICVEDGTALVARVWASDSMITSGARGVALTAAVRVRGD